MALRAALATAQGTARRPGGGGRLDGAGDGVVPVRSTLVVLGEIIDGAADRLLIVSFAAYKVPSVVERMAAALARGVTVHVVLDSPLAQGGRLEEMPA